MDVFRPPKNQTSDRISYGLNIYFKKPHRFSDDPSQGGGPFCPNQPYSSMQWGCMGAPPKMQVNLTDYVVANLKEVVFCRCGMDYLRSFPRNDDLTIGSFRVNLDYLIYQSMKKTQETDGKSLMEMSVLKAKGQQQMAKQIQQVADD